MVVNDRVKYRSTSVLAVIAAALLAGGCASASDQQGTGASSVIDVQEDSRASVLDPCAKPNLTTVEPGALTFATNPLPAPPFFLTDEPSDRAGLESDLAYELAAQLGFRPGEVTWEVVTSDQILSGEFLDYDVAIGGFSPTSEPASPLAFSQPYLEAGNVALTVPDDDRGSDGVVVIDEFSAQWLEVSQGRDLPRNSAVVVPDSQFALAMVSGNPLVPCVDQALSEMSEVGTLETLRQRWLDPRQWGDN